jgi:hypothetical protein
MFGLLTRPWVKKVEADAGSLRITRIVLTVSSYLGASVIGLAMLRLVSTDAPATAVFVAFAVLVHLRLLL